MTDEESCESIPFTLEDAALSYDASNIISNYITYKDAIDRLKALNTSEDQQFRAVQEWSDVSLKSWCKGNALKSQTALLRDMCSQLQVLCRQIRPDYQKNKSSEGYNCIIFRCRTNTPFNEKKKA